MAEINYNNLYNQLSPMEQRYYDQQFSKNYVPGQENIMLTSQPAYEQMKAAYEAEQQIPETGFFDSLFGSASAAEPPSVPNLSYQNITPTFNLGTGITNTSAATNMYTPFMSNQEMVNRDLVNELIQENQQKIASNLIDLQGDITDVDLPYSGIGSMRYKTPRTIADQNRVLGQTFTEEEPSGIQKLIKTAMRIAMPGLSFLENIAGESQPYQQFTPGGTIRNGIYSIDGVNVPVSSFGGDFYNPNTGLNRFDRARNRFNETRSLKDLFGASRTLAEFNNARKILEAQKKSGYKSDFMDRPKSERNYTGPGGGDNTGGDIGAKTAADTFSNKSGMGRTGY
jgi:hypothetical protein